MNNILTVVLSAIFSFLLLFIIAKLLGKKQIVELDFVDYVIGISLGSISAQWATDTVNPWYHYVIALAIFALASLLITLLSRTLPFFKKFLQGSPLILISDGKFVYENVKKSKLSVNDILGMCRDKNYFDLDAISIAVLETSGNLSILAKAGNRPLQLNDLNQPDFTPTSMPAYLIIDGRVFDEQLTQLDKDQKWLFESLNINDKADLKNILLASYDQQNNQFFTHLKNESQQLSPVK